MAKNRPQAVSEDDITRHFLGEKTEVSQSTKVLISPEPDNPAAPRPDVSAPERAKTICCVKQANLILAVAKRKIKNPLFKDLYRHWAALEVLNRFFARRQNWSRKMYLKYYHKRKKLHRQLQEVGDSASLKEVWEIREQLSRIRSQMLLWPHFQGILGLHFQPQFSFFQYNDKQIEKGAFVAASVDDRVRFNKLPFLLGWEDWSLPAACPEHIEELRDFRFKNKDDRATGFTKVDSLYAQTFKSASKRAEELKKHLAEQAEEKEKYYYEDERPEIINLDREKQIDAFEQTSFCAAFLVPEDLSDLDSVIRYLKALSQEEMDALEVMVIRNRGDNGEREWFGHKRKKNAKPNGWGWAGGKAEADPWREFSEKVLSPDLREQAKKDLFLYNLLSHANREFSNESCHELKKIFGRIARVQKGRNHVVHFWLACPERGATRTRGEIHEVDMTRILTLSELYQMPVGGMDAFSEYHRKDSVYRGHLIMLARFFKRHNLLMPTGMKKFLERLQD
jgi:hypothetical protein